MDKYQNKYRISSARLKGYDYGSNGMYFVTICTKNRLHYFGEIGSVSNEETDFYPSLQATPIGQITIKYWQEIPQHFPFVELDEFIIMPNHIHGVLFFNKTENKDWTPNKFGVQSQNLGSVIRGFKSSVKRYSNQNEIEFEWQSRYHDRIIRNDRELNAIRQYIKNNPANWNKDKLQLKYNMPETDNYPSLQKNIQQETESILKYK